MDLVRFLSQKGWVGMGCHVPGRAHGDGYAQKTYDEIKTHEMAQSDVVQMVTRISIFGSAKNRHNGSLGNQNMFETQTVCSMEPSDSPGCWIIVLEQIG